MADFSGGADKEQGRSAGRPLLEEYLQQVRDRLVANGSAVTDHIFTYGRAVIGMQRSRRWLGPVAVASAVVAVRSVTPDVCNRAIGDTVELAWEAHGSTMARPLSVVVVVAGETVTADARAQALERRPTKYGVGFVDGGAFVWPAVADLGSGEALYYRGPLLVGSVGSERIRQKLEVALGPLGPPRPA